MNFEEFLSFLSLSLKKTTLREKMPYPLRRRTIFFVYSLMMINTFTYLNYKLIMTRKQRFFYYLAFRREFMFVFGDLFYWPRYIDFLVLLTLVFFFFSAISYEFDVNFLLSIVSLFFVLLLFIFSFNFLRGFILSKKLVLQWTFLEILFRKRFKLRFFFFLFYYFTIKIVNVLFLVFCQLVFLHFFVVQQFIKFLNKLVVFFLKKKTQLILI